MSLRTSRRLRRRLVQKKAYLPASTSRDSRLWAEPPATSCNHNALHTDTATVLRFAVQRLQDGVIGWQILCGFLRSKTCDRRLRTHSLHTSVFTLSI